MSVYLLIEMLPLQINASDDRSSSSIEAKIHDVVQMNSVNADSKPKCLVSLLLWFLILNLPLIIQSPNFLSEYSFDFFKSFSAEPTFLFLNHDSCFAVLGY